MINKKIYPSEVTNEIEQIAGELNKLFKNQKENLRTIAKFASISVNSVKSVLAGETANIASYSLVAKALGTNLIDVVFQTKVSANKMSESLQPILK